VVAKASPARTSALLMVTKTGPGAKGGANVSWPKEHGDHQAESQGQNQSRHPDWRHHCEGAMRQVEVSGGLACLLPPGVFRHPQAVGSLRSRCGATHPSDCPVCGRGRVSRGETSQPLGMLRRTAGKRDRRPKGWPHTCSFDAKGRCWAQPPALAANLCKSACRSKIFALAALARHSGASQQQLLAIDSVAQASLAKRSARQQLLPPRKDARGPRASPICYPSLAKARRQ